MSLAKVGAGMIEVLVEVGAERARLAVRARSIPGALGVAEEHCLDGEARLVFPIDPERFFAGRAPGAVDSHSLRTPEGAAE